MQNPAPAAARSLCPLPLRPVAGSCTDRTRHGKGPLLTHEAPDHVLITLGSALRPLGRAAGAPPARASATESIGVLGSVGEGGRSGEAPRLPTAWPGAERSRFPDGTRTHTHRALSSDLSSRPALWWPSPFSLNLTYMWVRWYLLWFIRTRI